jgi:hypothetical protein
MSQRKQFSNCRLPTVAFVRVMSQVFEPKRGVHDSEEVADTDANKQNCKTESILN